jgi:predicted ATPase/class 3 adenylate cyclase/DNA-binding CsgD family transcriptional regulator
MYDLARSPRILNVRVRENPDMTGPRRALPEGTVALLLADVAGSTGLWENAADDMRTAVAELDAIRDVLIDRHEGVRPVDQGEGDSFVAAFARTSQAVACALDLQAACAETVLQLRMGIHCGEVEFRDEGNYVGPAINRTARLRDLGHGGQVLLSQAAADLVADALPEGASLLDLGVHRLRDLARPERAWQLCHPSLAATHPPLRSADARRDNLPTELTSFVGRVVEEREVIDLLQRSRAVTLTGAGGCGKTRLALHVAAATLDGHVDGSWFVDLSPVNDPDQVPIAVADAINVPLAAGSIVDQLARAIGEGVVLLVLDNCEHLVEACTMLADQLLRRCPSLVVLSTSREPLGIEGEVTYRVPSLAVPTSGDEPAAVLAGVDAVTLFVDRAQRARPTLALDDTNAPDIAEICRRLDGIPLAIELAAARVRVMAPAQIRAGLDDRFRLLTGGVRTAVPRQRALEASVDWSYALLLDAERTVLNRLSVFAGSFSLEAAEAVCGDDPLEPHHVADLVHQLVDKSLVVAVDDTDEPRFGLLETVRAYGASKLVDNGEADRIRARHHAYFLDLVKLRPGEDAAHRQIVTREYENIRRALQWAEAQPDIERLARLVTRLELFWTTGTLMRDGVHWFGVLVEREPDPRRRGVATGRWALLLSLYGEQERAVTAALAALDVARDDGDRATLLWTLLRLSQCFPTGSSDERVAMREALDLAIELDDRVAEAWAHVQLGTHLMIGDTKASLDHLERGLAIATDLRAEWLEQVARAQWIVRAVRDHGGPELLPELSAIVADLRAAGEGSAVGTPLCWLATLWELAGNAEEADRAIADGDAFIVEVGAFEAGLRNAAAHAAIEMLRGDVEPAIDRLSRVHSPFPDSQASYLMMLAAAEVQGGRYDDALRHVDEALALEARGWLTTPFGAPEYLRALVAREVGELERAEDLAYDAVQTAVTSPMAVHMHTGALRVLASVLARRDRVEDATRLFAAAQAEEERHGIRDNAVRQLEDGGGVASLHAALGDARFEELWDDGAAMTYDEATTYALRGRGPRRRPSSGWESLTPTEREVVDLVAEGASNADIAGRLFMAVATVKTHLTHVYSKLGVSSRTQLAAEAHRRRAAS